MGEAIKVRGPPAAKKKKSKRKNGSLADNDTLVCRNAISTPVGVVAVIRVRNW